ACCRMSTSKAPASNVPTPSAPRRTVRRPDRRGVGGWRADHQPPTPPTPTPPTPAPPTPAPPTPGPPTPGTLRRRTMPRFMRSALLAPLEAHRALSFARVLTFAKRLALVV